VQLLTEVMPGLSRVAVLWNATHQGKALEFRETERAARVMGVSIHSAEVRGTGDFEPTFASIIREKAEAVIVLAEPLVIGRVSAIRDFVMRHRLPATYQSRGTLAEGGGLLSYGSVVREQYRRAAYYVHRVLNGARPADLPVEQPTKFELVINMKTTKALGLTIPPALLLRADQVIE
jgi:putative ABC transport system substrate-binding protein